MGDTNARESLSEMISFGVRQHTSRLSPRVGSLVSGSRPEILTPTFIASTSRGAVPHVTPDLVQKHTSIHAVYAGLEDFLEKSRTDAPIFHLPQTQAIEGSTLRAYTALPETCISIVGARRVPRLSTPHQSTNSALAISTSVGFAYQELVDYNNAIWRLHPDISTTAVDLVQEDKISRKRIEKSADRTHAWLRDTVNEAENLQTSTPLFASIPPLEPEQQSFYLADLVDDFKSYLSGLCIYEPGTVAAIPETLCGLPVLCLSDPSGPHDILTTISLGIDLITVPFVTKTSEAGVALTFTFRPPSDLVDEPLGVDMWLNAHATDVSPLTPSCSCYACTRHHRAYLHHLLQAKEMLAWTLLQIHNFHVLAKFFEDIRDSITNGTFEEDSKVFKRAYQQDMPQMTGEGPRVRGYQVRSLGPGESKKNDKAFNRFDDQTLKLEEAESGIATPTVDEDAEVLEKQGLGKKID